MTGQANNQGRPSAGRSGFDPARAVVGLLAVAVVGAIVAIVIAPSPPAGPASSAAVSLEAKTFEGVKRPYRLRTPEGTPWRPLAEGVLRSRAPQADLGITRGALDTVVIVLVEQAAGDVPLDALASRFLAQEEGLQEVERSVVQKGEDRGVFLRVRKATGERPREGFVLLISRDDALYVVSGGAPMPISDALAAEISGIVRDVELPAAEVMAEPPAPPLTLAAPPPPSTALLNPAVRDLPPDGLRALARAAAGAGRDQEAATLAHLAVSKGLPDAMYDLACYEARSGRVDAALHWLQRAATDAGVDASWADEDEDLADVHKDPRWPQVRAYLGKMARYWAQHPVEKQVVTVPKGHVASRPIPVVVALHGLGSKPDDFGGPDIQKLADALSIAVVSVSGTKTQGPATFSWAEDVERDRARVEKALAAVRDRVIPAEGKVLLIGFSQGAQMAAEIAARQPARYAGAIVLSPGSRAGLSLSGLGAGTLAQRRFVIVAGAGEHPATVKKAADDADLLRAAGAEVHHKTYPDLNVHTIPPDFEQAFPRWVKFLLDGAPLP